MQYPSVERHCSGFAARLLVATLTLLCAALASAATPDNAASCIACHGDKGLSQDSDVPIIAGASDFFLENQLLLFQSKDRPCAAELFAKAAEKPSADDHCTLVEKFSEDEITGLAGYFSGLPHKAAEQPVDAALAQTGKRIHERSCDKCHADGGSLAMDDAGILAGQWKPYLVRTLKHYRDGDRWQDENMAKETAKLSDDDIAALVEYYASEGN